MKASLPNLQMTCEQYRFDLHSSALMFDVDSVDFLVPAGIATESLICSTASADHLTDIPPDSWGDDSMLFDWHEIADEKHIKNLTETQKPCKTNISDMGKNNLGTGSSPCDLRPRVSSPPITGPSQDVSSIIYPSIKDSENTILQTAAKHAVLQSFSSPMSQESSISIMKNITVKETQKVIPYYVANFFKKINGYCIYQRYIQN